MLVCWGCVCLHPDSKCSKRFAHPKDKRFHKSDSDKDFDSISGKHNNEPLSREKRLMLREFVNEKFLPNKQRLIRLNKKPSAPNLETIIELQDVEREDSETSVRSLNIVLNKNRNKIHPES